MGRPVNVSFVGQLPYATPGGDENRSDYRPVPAGDTGRDYNDRGALGGYAPPERAFDAPAEVRFEAGFGADVSDLKRGWAEPTITNAPAYDLDDYKSRSTVAQMSDNDEGGDSMADDYAFRRRNERARGFLTRPHLPTDR
jgi:hypothetical protein